MTTATREALTRVDAILRDAGWADDRPATGPDAEAVRAYRDLLQPDVLALLQKMCSLWPGLDQSGDRLGVGPDRVQALVAQAAERLSRAAAVHQPANN